MIKIKFAGVTYLATKNMRFKKLPYCGFKMHLN